MVNKKTLFGLGIIASVLVLGVGYAVVSTVELSFGGTATVGDAPIAVVIENVTSTKTDSATVTHSWDNNGDTADSFTISNLSLNETVTITYTLKNNETDVTATLSETGNISNSNSEYFEVTRTNSISELDPGEEGTFTIKVKLKKTPITEEEGTATISYKVKATPKSYSNSYGGGGGSN